MAKSANKLAIIATSITLSTTAMAYSISEHTHNGSNEKVWGKCNNGLSFQGIRMSSERLWQVQTGRSSAVEPSMDEAIRKACGE